MFLRQFDPLYKSPSRAAPPFEKKQKLPFPCGHLPKPTPLCSTRLSPLPANKRSRHPWPQKTKQPPPEDQSPVSFLFCSQAAAPLEEAKPKLSLPLSLTKPSSHTAAAAPFPEPKKLGQPLTLLPQRRRTGHPPAPGGFHFFIPKPAAQATRPPRLLIFFCQPASSQRKPSPLLTTDFHRTTLPTPFSPFTAPSPGLIFFLLSPSNTTTPPQHSQDNHCTTISHIGQVPLHQPLATDRPSSPPPHRSSRYVHSSCSTAVIISQLLHPKLPLQ